MKSYINQPVFICGHRKTGTTMLLCLLDSHPQLLVYPADSAFFYALYPRSEEEQWPLKKKLDRLADYSIANLKKEVNDLASADRKKLSFSISQFTKDFKAQAGRSGAAPKELLKSLISAFAKNSGQNIGPVERWVEKTTSTEIYATEIIKWFPRAKFIQLVRDPRDNWAALKAAWEGRYRKFNDSSLTLLQSLLERGKLGMELAILNQKIIGRKQYLIVRFEDLVSQPKKYLTEICKFLNIKYQADLLKPTVLGKWWPGNSFENLKFKGPSKAKVGQWPKRITKEEAHLVEYYFYDLMKHFNYRPKSTLKQRVAAAVKHYKWHNFAQVYSFADAKITKYTKKDS
ncbi:MAG TPA: sulfotransferase [Patescibacteria group bacterium]|nr:sulfotransferase [Patescibacteria group bacterium]